ncbi:MAG: DEAD/DEAH box helicase [Bacteroidaceae bacterium]
MTYNLPKLGITELNVMQQDMLQAMRRWDRVVLLSPTGSGKTLAYLLPVLDKMDERKDHLQTLVLVPSRELAIQTTDVVRRLCPECRVMACYGGRAAMDEHRSMKGLRPQMIVATPGRFLDHVDKGNVFIGNLETLVIDEFDKSLELGFQSQMEAIIQQLGHVHRRILLSATDNPSIPAFAGGDDFHRLTFLDSLEQIPERIFVYRVDSPDKDKLETLLRLVCMLGAKKSLVFLGFRESVERVGNYLCAHGVAAVSYHGGMEQQVRERAIHRFSCGSCNVLVCTDLAARGLDIEGVENVIHYHLPADQVTYVHRNGRTARWDNDGNAYLIVGPQEKIPDFVDGSCLVYHIPQRIPAPAAPLWATLYIGKGKKDKISRGDVAGFLSKVGGLAREQIGRIDILPQWSYVAVDNRRVRQLLTRIKGQKIKGIKTIFALAD